MSPPSLREWIAINAKIGALSFGSTSRILLFQDELVERRGWLTPDQFQEALTVAQMMPGPNLVNFCAYVGYFFFAFRGAVLGSLALALPGALLTVVVLTVVPFENPTIKEWVRGITLGSIAIIAVLVLRLIRGLAGAPRRKIALRGALAAAIAVALYVGFPFFEILGAGVATAVAIEFAA